LCFIHPALLYRIGNAFFRKSDILRVKLAKDSITLVLNGNCCRCSAAAEGIKDSSSGWTSRKDAGAD
jgi:hypothetical protein